MLNVYTALLPSLDKIDSLSNLYWFGIVEIMLKGRELVARLYALFMYSTRMHRSARRPDPDLSPNSKGLSARASY